MEGADMDLGCPVLGFSENACVLGSFAHNVHGYMCQGVILGSPTKRHESADIGRYRGDIGGNVREKTPTADAGFTQFIRLHEGNAALVDDNAPRSKNARAVHVKIVGEQHLTDSDRIG